MAMEKEFGEDKDTNGRMIGETDGFLRWRVDGERKGRVEGRETKREVAIGE